MSSDDAFVEDLFRSRFTKFTKLKIVVDPSSNPLETGLIKKIAFVELSSFADQNRVLKWQDLSYQGGRRVLIEMADFMDFKHTMEFNQLHAEALASAEKGSVSHRSRPQIMGRGTGRPESHRGPALLHRATSPPNGHNTPILGTPTLAKAPLAPKPNPFGNAKPVDVDARLHEMDKLLITVNQTTIRTAGTPQKKAGRRTKSAKDSSNKEPDEEAIQKQDGQGRETGDSPAKSAGMKSPPPPPSIYDLKHSLANLLSTKPEEPVLSRSASGTPKLKASKPVILKKPPSVVSSPAHQQELERSRTPAAEPSPKAKPSQEADDVSPPKEPASEERKEKLDRVRKRREVKAKDNTKKDEEQKKLSHGIVERNKLFSSEDHPQFKEHLNEITQEKQQSRSRRSRLSREKRRSRRTDGLAEQTHASPAKETGEKSPETSQRKTPQERPRDRKPQSDPDVEEVRKRAPKKPSGSDTRSEYPETTNSDQQPGATNENDEGFKGREGQNRRRRGNNRGSRRRRKSPGSGSKPVSENGA